MKQITVTYASGEKRSYPGGVKASELIDGFGRLDWPLAAVLVNNELLSLDARLRVNCTVLPVTIDSVQGSTIYRRSLCFLLALASRELFPERRLVAGMSLSFSFYHFFQDEDGVSKDDLAKLRAKMRELVERDVPINREEWAYEEAVEYFKKSGQNDTLLLLDQLNSPRIPLNECAGFRDLLVAPLVPSTGVLGAWELETYHEGILIRYPHKETPDKVAPFVDNPVLFNIAKEYKEKAEILGVSSVGALNRVVASKDIQNYIRVAEALQNKRLAAIADMIAERADKVKMVLLAGPSSSGKTTTAKKLAIQLKVMGFRPINISLDDYYNPPDKAPLDEEGKPDLECIEALDIDFLNQQLIELSEGKEVDLARYDFKTQTRKFTGHPVQMTGREILVIEGIHGLNDRLTPRIPREQKFKVYLSALTQLNLDDHNRISTTDNRLLRRMVRDYNFRSYSAANTLRVWPSVGRGERRNIFPFQGTADAVFNSALDYELGVLKVFAVPLLRTVKPSMPEYSEAKRLEAFLDNFTMIPAQYVPRDSILREFIGESEFKY